MTTSPFCIYIHSVTIKLILSLLLFYMFSDKKYNILLVLFFSGLVDISFKKGTLSCSILLYIYIII